MKEERKKIISLISVGAVLLFLVVAYFTTTEDTVQESFWSLLPPLIAIVLALGTKEVYSSLFIGILSGGLLFSGFSIFLWTALFLCSVPPPMWESFVFL